MTHMKPGDLVCNYTARFYLGAAAVEKAKSTKDCAYILYGKHHQIKWCLDYWSEEEYGHTIGRLINHSRKST